MYWKGNHTNPIKKHPYINCGCSKNQLNSASLFLFVVSVLFFLFFFNFQKRWRVISLPARKWEKRKWMSRTGPSKNRLCRLREWASSRRNPTSCWRSSPMQLCLHEVGWSSKPPNWKLLRKTPSSRKPRSLHIYHIQVDENLYACSRSWWQKKKRM